jgi:hypothetical protein
VTCSRCGGPLKDGDRFCGRCGQPVAGAAEGTTRDRADDFFAEWEDDLAGLPRVDDPTAVPGRPTDEATTESIPTARPHDTAVLPAQPHTAPRRPPPGPALAPKPRAPQPTPVRPPAPAPPPPRSRRGVPVGAIFALLGAAAVVVSAALPWTRAGLTGVIHPRDLPFAALLDPNTATSGPSLATVLLGGGLLGAFLALITMAAPGLKFLRRIVGLLTLAVVGLFAFRLAQGLVGAAALDRFFLITDAGIYVAAAGAVTQMVAGRWFRR